MFTFDGHGIPIAIKLQEEGNDILVAQIEDASKVKMKEDKESKERRLTLGDGIVKKEPADKVLEKLLKLSDAEKRDYFIICDFNNQYYYSEPLIEAGFTGLLPTKEDMELEQDRAKAKEFVLQHFPYLNVPETYEFKTIKEGIEFLKKEQDIYVLKGNYEECATIVPKSNDVNIAREELIEALERDKQNYERQGFVFERKIIRGIEFIPEGVWMDGVLLGVSVDIETKYIGSGNIGYQVGCAQDLVFLLSLDHSIYEMFLKPHEEIAKQRKGLFIGDAGVIWDIDKQKFYFLEYCQGRFGFNCIFTELSLFDKVSEYFERIRNLIPLYNWQRNQPTHGASVRIFNLLRGEDRRIIKDIKIKVANPKFVWLWDVKKEGKDYVNAGYDKNLAVITGRGYDLYQAVEDCYENLRLNFYFPEMYYRPKFDFLNESYDGSIVTRYNFVVNFDWERYKKEYDRRNQRNQTNS